MKRSLDVAVVGAGTAGAAAAIFLARLGHRISLFERVPDPRPVGAGIVLQPTGMSVLAALGILERVVARGARIDRLRCVTPQGRAVVDLSYREVDPNWFGLGIHRGALFSELLGQVHREGIQIHTGVDVGGVVQGIEKTGLFDGGRRGLGEFDLVVVADGARSTLRRHLRLSQRIREYAWGAMWFVAEDHTRAYTNVLEQTVDGTSVMLGLLPTGLGPSGSVPLVSLFWSVRGDRVDAVRSGWTAWKEKARRLDPRSDAIIAQIPSADALLYTGYHDVVLSRWNDGRVVCIGDAAHATSPQLGQGCNLALVDAAVLGACIAEIPDVREALARFSRARRAHLSFYQRATRWLTPFFQSDVRSLGSLRALGAQLFGNVPWVQRQMTLSMAGVHRGVFRAPLALPSTPVLGEGRA